MAEHLTGLHAVEEAIRAGRRGTLYVEKRNKRTSVIMERAAAGGIEVVSCRPGGIVKRTGLSTETGILFALSGERAPGASRSFTDALDSLRGHSQTILFLDGITDPQNFGAILRCADQFAVDLVVRQERRSAGETDAVARASAGCPY
jgi:23S rRNA (guanosine2251-2'-O)-methyltransferase